MSTAVISDPPGRSGAKPRLKHGVVAGERQVADAGEVASFDQWLDIRRHSHPRAEQHHRPARLVEAQAEPQPAGAEGQVAIVGGVEGGLGHAGGRVAVLAGRIDERVPPGQPLAGERHAGAGTGGRPGHGDVWQCQ